LKLFPKYYQNDKIKEDEMDGACNKHESEEKCMHIFDRKRHRRGWNYCSKMQLQEIGWKDTDWLHLAQDRDRGGLFGMHSDSVTYWELLECLNNFWLLKEDSAPWS
jgi:hypothetical protein